MNAAELKETAKNIRLLTIRTVAAAKTAHLGSSLSAIEIFTALYFKILNVDPARAADDGRDRFIMSKGHAAAGFYATLATRGFLTMEQLSQYYKNDGILPGHSSRGIPGIEVSTGSLGHGLPLGNGMAMAAKKDGRPYRVFVLMSDGECDEGSNWEAILFAGHHKLDNLVAIVDYNKVQSFGRTADVMNLEPFAAKWKNFNWGVREVDGHDLPAIVAALEQIPFEPGRPSVLIAHTIKGKGMGAMEDSVQSHYLLPPAEEMEGIINSIQNS